MGPPFGKDELLIPNVMLFLLLSLLYLSTFSEVLALSMMNADALFPYCHSSIADILACEKREASSKHVWLNGHMELQIEPFHEFSVEDLVPLAHECDQAIFGQRNQVLESSPSPCCQALIQLGRTGDSSKITTATLIALNHLESSIRHTTGYETGRAPLLKTMLSELDSNFLSQVLQCLLLPTGLNLRNLLWHGFVGSIPRPWLALVLVLNENLQTAGTQSPARQDAIKPLSQTHPNMELVVARGKTLRLEGLNSCNISNWLPQSHVELWNLAVDWMTRNYQYPAIVCAILTVLLEHGLRLDWCRLNDRMQDIQARPHVFYVTLDGHGQRHKHDMILHPYLVSDETKNKLITNHLGASTTALLTDLYASSCGGPNIRAALAHGVWDGYLERELVSMIVAEPSESSGEDDPLWDMVDAILVAMEQVAKPSKTLDYRPIFSYTATTIQSLEQLRKVLARLEKYREDPSFADTQAVLDIPESVNILSVPTAGIESYLDELLVILQRDSTSTWTAKDVFAEHETNRRLAPLGATRTLLDEVVTAAMAFDSVLQEAVQDLHGRDDHRSRERRRLSRIVASSQVASSVYTFAELVALLSLKQELDDLDISPTQSTLTDESLLKAVKRTRMVVSTVATFLTTNAERAFKSIDEFTKGKAIKAILKQKEAILSHPQATD